MKRKGRNILVSFLVLTTVTVGTLIYRNINNTPALQQIRHYEGITEYRLQSNGLTVLLIPDAASSSTTVNMTYKVGSLHERVGQTGIAHLLEHMVFRGNANIRNSLAEFSKRGLSANGTTTEDRTNYFATFPANDEPLEWYLGWQSDAMVSALLSPEDLEAEKTVVRNELEQDETSNISLLLEQVRKTAFQTHSYGHSVLGSREDIQHTTVEDLRQFYETFYQPDNAVLIIAGSFDAAATLEKITKIFSKIPRPERSLPASPVAEAIQEGERRVTVRRPGGTPLALAVYHAPTGADSETTALRLAAQMLGDSTSGRLNWELVDHGLATNVFGEAFFLKAPGILAFMASAAPEQSPYDVLHALTRTVETVAQYPFTELELARAKRLWLNRWAQMRHDPHQIAVALSDAIALGDWRLLFQRHDWLENISLETVQQAAEHYLIASNRTEGIYLPTEDPVLPPQARTIDLESQLVAYVSDPDTPPPVRNIATLQETTDFEPTFEYVQSHTDIQTFTHKNGKVKIALLPKPTSGQRAQAFIRLQFGDLQSLRDKREIASAAVDLLSSGNEAMPYQQLEDKFAELDSDYTVGGSATSASILLRSHHDTLEAALHLAFHVLKTPDYPKDQVNEWINTHVTNLSNAMHDPEEKAQLAWRLHTNIPDKHDVRYMPSFQETIHNLKKISRDDVLKFHDEFYGANDVLVVIVGDFESEPAVDAILEELDDWQAGKPYTRIPEEHRPVTPIEILQRTPGKSNAVMITALNFPMRATDPDYAALLTANTILGGSHDSRLWKRIRDKEGLTYGIESTLNVSLCHDDASWGIHASYAPQNKERIQKLVLDEVSKVLQDGFTQQELDAAKQSSIQFRRLALADNNGLIALWMNTMIDGMQDLRFETELLARIEALSLDDVNQAFKKYVRPKNLVKIHVGDFTQGKTITKNQSRPS